MTRIKGNHPYADKFPMASQEELEELTASIATVGLINPIVLTPNGLVLDGRNRLLACQQASVEPVFVERDGTDDELKEFVIGVNTTGRRESMTVQIAAAATALILGAEKRINGQWRRGSVPVSSESGTNGWKQRVAEAGLVLDILGAEALEAVRDSETTLNAAYERARKVKEVREAEERARIEEARDEQQREDKAGRYFDNHPEAQQWLNSKPQGTFETMRGAYAAYLEHDREARLAELEKKRKEEAEKREHEEMIARHARYVQAFITNFQTGLDMATWPIREEVLEALDQSDAHRFLAIEAEYLVKD